MSFLERGGFHSSSRFYLRGVLNMTRMNRSNISNTHDIDLTPMLDVVFIMLIFFIVTASFVKEVGINPNVPPPRPAIIDIDPQNILVRISADNQIWFFEKDGERRIDTRAIRSVIERARAENPKASVIIQASGKADTSTYVSVADAVKESDLIPILVPQSD
jgi:biopolymer transport protein ExbD